MAITEVTERRAPRLDMLNKSGSRSYLVHFNAFTNYNDMFNEAAAAEDPSTGLSIPQKGTNFDGDEPAKGDPLVTGISVELYDEQNMILEVNVTWSKAEETGSETDGGNGMDEYPWNLPKVYSWGHSNIEKRMVKDLDDNAIVNSYGDPFDEIITRPVSIRTLTVTWNKKKSAFNPIKANSFINTLNRSAFNINGSSIPREKALCTGYDGTLTYTTARGKQIQYYQVSASWSIITQGNDEWDGMVLDVGYNQLLPTGPNKILLKGGVEPSSPQLLNGKGVRLKAANGDQNPDYSGAGTFLPIHPDSNKDRVFLQYKPFGLSNHSSII